jgi:hypothetical protein
MKKPEPAPLWKLLTMLESAAALLRGPDPDRVRPALARAVEDLGSRPLDAADRMILSRVAARLRRAAERLPRHIPEVAELESRAGLA